MIYRKQKYNEKVVLPLVRLMNTLFRFLRFGIPESRDPLESRRVMLLNLFFLLSAFTLIASLIHSFLTKEPRDIQVVHVIALTLLAFIPLLARRNSHAASIVIVFIVNSIIFFFCNTQGIDSGTFLFYFPLFLANGWLMDFRKPVYCAALIGITMLSVIMVVLLPDPVFGVTISDAQREASFVFNLICASVVLAINTLVIIWMNYRRHIELETEIAEKEKLAGTLGEALKEKEVLIAEIHHRVKNNLAVVRGLLNMQMNTTTNEAAKEPLRESVSRVTAMALIHQKLYSHAHADAIDMKKYIEELVREVAASYQPDGGALPEVNIHVEHSSLDLNHAVPCGLILNELLTNAFKHAFNGSSTGIIDIAVVPDADHPGYINMTVRDNGKGFEKNFSPETKDTLGMTIIRSLSEQLDGTFVFSGAPGKGTQAIINFPSANGVSRRN